MKLNEADSFNPLQGRESNQELTDQGQNIYLDRATGLPDLV